MSEVKSPVPETSPKAQIDDPEIAQKVQTRDPEPAKVATSAKKYLTEAVIGVLIGSLVLWVLIVSVSDVEFIYQGF